MKVPAIILSIFILFLVAQLPAQMNTITDPASRPTIEENTREISRLIAEGKTAQEIFQLQQQILQPTGTGTITGTVFQSGGEIPLPNSVSLTAYDQYGFYSGSGYIYAGNSAYTISNLAPGLHYIQAFPYGNFQGAFYENVMDWQQATLVYTVNDSITDGINFELETGKVISGKVLEEISLNPLTGMNMQFSLYKKDARTEQDVFRFHFFSPAPDGSYYLHGLSPGEYKLYLFNEYMTPEFYNDKETLYEADILTLTAETDTLRYINFLLGPVVGVQDGYEPNGNYQDAWQLSIGDSVTPMINPRGDIDFFSFSGTAGDSVIFELKAKSIGSSLYPNLIVYDSTGTSWLINFTGPDFLTPPIRLPYTGLYFCRIIHYNMLNGGEDYYYTIRLNLAPQLETGGVSGNVYLDDMQTPYSGQGYWIELYNSDTQQYFTSPMTEAASYVISGIPVGNYKIRINPTDFPYLPEWFDNVRFYEEADLVTVSTSDTTDNINFILDKGSSISGRLFLDNLSTDFTAGGYIYVYESTTGMMVGSSYVSPNDEGLYTISGLPAGELVVAYSSPYPWSMDYPPVYYDAVGAFGQATPVTTTFGDTTGNINFILIKGGEIQGFIYLSDGHTTLSNDSLRADVLVYDPLSGDMTGFPMFSTFSGGYRTPLLYPGNYKLQVLNHHSTLASYYYDGGSTYDDINTMNFNVQSDSIHELNITLDIGEASISGIVYEEDGTTPTEKIGMIYAYDASGHMVQSVTIGYDPIADQPLETGHYRLAGLKSGNYYLMLTFDYTGMIMMRNKTETDNATDNDLIMTNRQSRIGRMDISIREIWYNNVFVHTEIDMFLFVQDIPDGATAVAVIEPGETTNINFSNITSAISQEEIITVPIHFEIESIYPNPFNPVTSITYTVPHRSRVQIEIFDILGQRVSTVLDEVQGVGRHSVQWQGRNNQNQPVSSGIYIARLKADDTLISKKMVLLR